MNTDFSHQGFHFTIQSFQLDDNNWGCALFPAMGANRGLVICEPDVTKEFGRPVRFDSEDEAIEAGKNYIGQDFLR